MIEFPGHPPEAIASASLDLVLIGTNSLFLDTLVECLRNFAEFDSVTRLTPGELASPVAEAADVLVVDVEAGDDALATLSLVLDSAPAAAVLALIEKFEPALVVGLLRRGASAFATKDASVQSLVKGISRLAGGRVEMLASFLIELLAEAARQQSVQVELEARFRSLSRREHEVLELLVAGRNASDAAKSLYVSANTVRTHTRHIFGKLGVRSQVEAITLASRVGYTRLLRAGGIGPEQVSQTNPSFVNVS